jgi:hypothetical protein
MGIKAGQNYESTNTNEYTAASAIEPYRLVKQGTNEGEVEACTAITDVAIGVSLNKAPAAGDRVQIQTRGVAMIATSAPVSRGAQVMPTAAGAGKVSTAAGATARSAGLAEAASGADGEVIAVRINLPNLNGPANA